VFFVVGGCTCQRPENIEAKKRMSSPPPANPVKAWAQESLDPSDLVNNDKLRHRVNRMSYAEIQERLGTFQLVSEGQLDFSRSSLSINSVEKTRLLQSMKENFSLVQETSENDRMQVIYVNEVLFLKNRNGKWRTSRDPTGERAEMLDDASGVWRSFYDLFQHAMVWEREADGVLGTREVVQYELEVTDKSETLPAVPRFEGAPVDAGVERDKPKLQNLMAKRLSDKESLSRLSKWRELSRAANGKGRVKVDKKTGVILMVEFRGNLVVGDDKKPARLHVEIDLNITDIGHQRDVSVPKDAISEVTRKRWPVKPRKFLEKEGLVEPLVEKEEGSK
jgi:hypothetical protein